MEQNIVNKVADFYEERPYPSLSLLSPIFMGVRKDDLPLLNYRAGFAACFGSTKGASNSPKILVAGAGTFEAIAVAMANPQAEILAVDLSSKSLKKLSWMAKCRGLKIKTQAADLESVQGVFDYIIATGVLHHLENPQRGLQHLKTLSHPHTVFRFMLYSRWGRDLLYRAKELASLLGIEDPKGIRRMIASLPDNHPYKIYFHLYTDTSTDDGLADGYLHPCDQPFDAFELRDFLKKAELDQRKFLHRPEGQPENYIEQAHLDIWSRLALQEIYGDLEENFCFFAADANTPRIEASGNFEWNPALPEKADFFSRLTGTKISFQKSDVMFLNEKERAHLVSALFLLPGGSA